MNYLLGGYYLIAPYERPTDWDEQTFPVSIISASTCLCDIHPDTKVMWGKSYKSKFDYMKELEITEQTYDDMAIWVDSHLQTKEFLYPQLFANVASARRFYKKFLSHLPHLKLIGLGLPEHLAADYLDEEETLIRPVERRLAIENFLVQREFLDTHEGIMQGFEILGNAFNYFHSYLCNSQQELYKSNFDFQLNPYGLIDSLEDASKYSDFSNQLEVPAEPVLWLPWAIYEYELIDN